MLTEAGHGAVQVWLTTPDQTHLLARRPDVAFVDDAAAATVTVTVGGTREYQRIEGFGASFTESSAVLVHDRLPVMTWNMALDQNAGPTNGGCQDCRGVVTVDTATGAVTYNVEYFVLGHASKFVVPGAVRIASTCDHVESVAFRNPDGSHVLIVLNPAGEPHTVTVSCDDGAFRYRLPAGAVATFRWDRPTQRRGQPGAPSSTGPGRPASGPR